MRTENYGMAIKAYDEAFKLDNTNSNILSRKAIALYYK
jgi:cytochrome c-type biogenesis protein CcmH/NrfG